MFSLGLPDQHAARRMGGVVMFRLLQRAILGTAILATGCSSAVDVQDIPIGADVQLTRTDGVLVEGTLAERDDRTVKIEQSPAAEPKAVPVEEIADIRVVEAEAPPPEPPPLARFREITVPADTPLSLEVRTKINTGAVHAGDVVTGVLVETVVVDGVDVLPAGSQLTGHVTEATASGKVKGRAHLAIEFDRITANDGTYSMAARFEATAPSTKKSDTKKIGIPAVGGAVLGAVLGGKKGAAVGAAIGGGAGTAAVLMTDGGEVELAEGARLTLPIGQAVEVKVPIR
jgi:hypothetical protein